MEAEGEDFVAARASPAAQDLAEAPGGLSEAELMLAAAGAMWAGPLMAMVVMQAAEAIMEVTAGEGVMAAGDGALASVSGLDGVGRTMVMATLMAMATPTVMVMVPLM